VNQAAPPSESVSLQGPEYVEDPTENHRHYDAPRADNEQLALRIVGGSDSGMVLELEDESYVLGRARGVDIRIDCHGVSRIHARVTRRGDHVTVEDLGSRNGTWLENTRLYGRQRLIEGQRIRIGDTVLRLSRLDQHELASARALSDAARKDPLTACFNRGHFDSRLCAEVDRTRKNERSTSLVLLDLDHFKKINDRHGHTAGDAILRAVGQALLAVTRLDDVVARYGGEEFAIIVPAGTQLGAALLAQRARTAIEQMVVQSDGQKLRVTASLGVATLECGTVASAHELVRAADEALYAAKHEGRNRVHIGQLRTRTDEAPCDVGVTVTEFSAR
jgi:two-component system cell cycle response regulator